MTELQPGDNNNINNNQQLNGIVSTSAEPPPAPGSKRLRRPSVRLGEIGGDQYHYDPHTRKSKWTTTGNNNNNNKSSRTRTLTNLSSGYENLDDGSWRVKKRPGSAKRVRSNWVSKTDHGDELEGGFRDFSREDSESPLKEESFGRRSNREFEVSEPGVSEGVKVWLEELGLGRYWPMFEIHEVDDEVLPFLTLEDLKDMGINAVGSRRKMFCAIEKLGREFS